MIDRIVVSSDLATIVYTDRLPLIIRGDGKTPITTFLRWVLAPSVTVTYPEFVAAVSIENENTQEIAIDEILAS